MHRTYRGRREFAALTGRPPHDGLARVRQCSPQMYEAVIEGAYGGTLAQAELTRTARAIATLAIAAAQGDAEAQLAAHTETALRCGLEPSELLALCEHVAVYAGLPRGLAALAAVDEVLAHQGVPQPPQLHPIELSDHHTVVAQKGDAGPAVVLLHEIGLDWRMWEPVMNRLAASCRVYAYDLRGHGRAAGGCALYTLADAAADLFEVMDHMALERAHVVGLSFGGAIAQTAALVRPERVESLALLSAADRPPSGCKDAAESAETLGMEAQVVPTLTRWFTAQALAADAWGVRYARERILRGDPVDWAAAWRAFGGLDLRGGLMGFPAPVLLLGGALDACCPPEPMEAVAGRLGGAVHHRLRGLPHLMALEQPEQVARALELFLPEAQDPPERIMSGHALAKRRDRAVSGEQGDMACLPSSREKRA